MRLNILAVFVVAATAVLLGGCFETDRPTSYDKGVYGGKADQKLTSDQVEALRQRGMHQE